MKKMRALDLYCGDGGATKGLQMAGFHVTGVDNKPHPRYCGDVFIGADALDVPLKGYDFIWASPPCQKWSALARLRPHKQYPDLISATRDRLVTSGIPYAIENVEDAPLGESGYLIVLCGTMFGLETADGRAELRRHRIFETSFSIPLRPRCQHDFRGSLSVAGSGLDDNKMRNRRRVLTVVGHTPVDNAHVMALRRQVICVAGDSPVSSLGTKRKRAISVTGSTPQTNTVRNSQREVFSVNDARHAMGIDWMTMKGLSQAVPPAYSHFIAQRFLEQKEAARA